LSLFNIFHAVLHVLSLSYRTVVKHGAVWCNLLKSVDRYFCEKTHN
jgi:hypothetical protein